MREPSIEWLGMARRVDAFLQSRLPSETPYDLVKVLMREMLLKDQALRQDYRRVLEVQVEALMLREQSREELKLLIAGLKVGVEINDDDSPQRVVKLGRKAMTQAVMDGAPSATLAELERLVSLVATSHETMIQSGPALRTLETHMEKNWKELEEYLEVLDRIMPPDLENREELLAEWKQVRRVELWPDMKPREAA